MTDRSLIKDAAEHARRSNPLADTDRIAQIRSLHAARILPCTHEERGMLLTEIDRLTAERDGHQSGREQLRAISREHRAERDRYRAAWQSARLRAEGSHLTAVANAEACDHARQIGNQLHARVTALAADMRTWCSPHGLANHYADQLDRAIAGPGGQP